jgi:transmembrane 9 superfamily protein 2/4
MLGLIIFGVVSLAQGTDLPVKVNKITSTKTQLPYEYYSLDYCPPEKIINSAENLGEVLRGDRIENSPYVVCFSETLLETCGHVL